MQAARTKTPSEHTLEAWTSTFTPNRQSGERIARVQMLEKNRNFVNVVRMRVFASDRMLKHIERMLNPLMIVDINVS